jgi:DNA (cytosine-5)-methyltransferase 1
MKELSLFSGAGGGLLGTKLLGFKTIGYVEIDGYCQKVLRQRIADGILDSAPIFGDIRKFISEGYAEAYKGMVNVVTAGFPCQPFSVAGKRKQEADERNMWPATATVIQIVCPKFVLIENVPGIRQYLPVVIRDLRRLGYVVRRPIKLGADDVGAPHRRKRLWILAYSKIPGKMSKLTFSRERLCAFNCRQSLADSIKPGLEKWEEQELLEQCQTFKRNDPEVPNTESEQTRGIFIPGVSPDLSTDSNGSGKTSWWATEPDVGRVANGVAHRVDRLKAIGNGQIPFVAATAWKILINLPDPGEE